MCSHANEVNKSFTLDSIKLGQYHTNIWGVSCNEIYGGTGPAEQDQHEEEDEESNGIQPTLPAWRHVLPRFHVILFSKFRL